MSDHASREHAQLGASSCERWWNCPGTFRMAAAVVPEDQPEQTSEYARRGTALHEVAEICVNENVSAASFIGQKFLDYTVTGEDANGLQIYVDLCGEFWSRNADSAGYTLLVEHRFSLEKLHPPGPMFGTADFVAVNRTKKHLTVVDLKCGAGIVVDAQDNKQAKYYALGALCSLPEGTPIDTVETIIVQPFAPGEPIRRASYTSADIIAWGAELLKKAKEALDPDAPCHAGPWCRKYFCPASGRCPVEAQAAMDAAQIAFSTGSLAGEVLPPIQTPPDVKILTPEQIGDLLLAFENIVEPFIASVKETAQALLTKGVDVPGWQLTEGQGKRQWIDEEKVTTKLAEAFDVQPDDLVMKRVGTPAYVERVLINKLRELGLPAKKANKVVTDTVAKFTIRPVTSVRLVKSHSQSRLPAATDVFQGEPLPSKPDETSDLFV